MDVLSGDRSRLPRVSSELWPPLGPHGQAAQPPCPPSRPCMPPWPTCSRLARPLAPRSWRGLPRSTSATSDRVRRAWSASSSGPGRPASAPRLHASWARSREVCCARVGESSGAPRSLSLERRGARKAPGLRSSLARDQSTSTVSRAPRLGTRVAAVPERKVTTACSAPELSRDWEAWDHRIWARAGPLLATASWSTAAAFSCSCSRSSNLAKWGLATTRCLSARFIVCRPRGWSDKCGISLASTGLTPMRWMHAAWRWQPGT